MINCKTVLDFSWSKNCIISEILNNAEVPDNPTGNQLVEHIPEGSPTYASFEINDIIEGFKDLKEVFLRTDIDLKQQHNSKTTIWIV